MTSMGDYVNSRKNKVIKSPRQGETPEFEYGLYTEEEGILSDEYGKPYKEESEFPERIAPSVSQRLIPDSIRQRFPSESPIDELFKGVPGGVEGAIGAADAVLGTVAQVPNVLGSMYGTVEGIAKSVADDTYGTQEGARSAFDQSQQRAADVSEYLSGAGGYELKTEAGNKLMENLGNVTGRYVPPLLAGGVAPILRAPRIPKINKSEETAQRIMRGSGDADLAKKRIPDPEGFDRTRTIINDKEAAAVIDQGFEPKTLQMIKQASPADKKRMLEMIDLRKQGLSDLLIEQQGGPSQVIGREFQKGIVKIKTDLSAAGKNVGRASENLKGVAIDGAVIVGENFRQSLRDVLNVDFDPQTGARNYNNSQIQMSPKLQGLLDRIIGRVSGWEKKGKKFVYNPSFEIRDAHDLHVLKQAISELVSYEKQGDGLTGVTETVVKGLRADINKYLKNIDTNYDQANQEFAALKSADDLIMSVVGKKADLDSEFVTDRLGKISRRLASGGINVDQLKQAISEMQELGAFKDTDLMRIMLFAEKMDDALGQPSRMNSFLGASQRAMEGAATNQPPVSAAIDLAKGGIDAMRGINEKNLLESTRKLLLRDLNENKRRQSQKPGLPVER
tara:strand:+ start:883 stop:2739 length:1857 start_codon:yes stop_codon:yes gene_type:complete